MSADAKQIKLNNDNIFNQKGYKRQYGCDSKVKVKLVELGMNG